MVFWFGIFGEEAETKIQLLKKSIKFENDRTCLYYGENWSLFVEQSNFSPLPTNPIWIETDNNKLGIALHGVAILKDIELDEFLKNPHIHLANLLSRRKSNLISLPKEFTNGTFVGTILKPAGKTFYLFTDFLGLIPLYYIERNGHLYFSTSLYLLTAHPDIPVEWYPPAIDEYLEYGAIISSNTVLKNIKVLPFASILSFSQKGLSINRWHRLPKESGYNYSFRKCLHETHRLWERVIKSLQSNNIRICLSLSGGMDSRLIFTEWPKKETLITETGNSKNDPDYILARKLVEAYGVQFQHILEPQHEENFFREYINTLLILDNPLIATHPMPLSHYRWKKEIGVQLLFLGLGGEIFGGDFLWKEHSIKGLLKEAFLPFRLTALDEGEKGLLRRAELLDLSMNRLKKRNLNSFLKKGFQERINDDVRRNSLVWQLDSFIGPVKSEQAYLERLRLALKYTHRHIYVHLPNRIYHETIYPYFDIEFMDHLVSIPIKYRKYRKFMFAFLNKYYLEAGDVPVTTSYLKAKRPYFIHRVLKPLVKGINMGYKKKIPLLQPREMVIRKESDITMTKQREGLMRFLTHVIETSSLFNKEVSAYLDEFERINDPKWTAVHKTWWENVWRLYCLSLAEKRFFMNPQQYQNWLKSQVVIVSSTSTPEDCLKAVSLQSEL